MGSRDDQSPPVPEGILSAVAFAARGFLRASGWKDAVAPGLRRLGEAAGASRAYVFENEKLPAFSAPGLDGSTVSSAVGQPSVVAIWASWCLVCQEELVILNKVEENYPGVKVISITTMQGLKSGTTAEQFVADQKIDIPVAVDDESQDLRLKMGVLSFPVLYFVNADGTVYKGKHGLLDEAELSPYFETRQQQADHGSLTPTPKPGKWERRGRIRLGLPGRGLHPVLPTRRRGILFER